MSGQKTRPAEDDPTATDTSWDVATSSILFSDWMKAAAAAAAGLLGKCWSKVYRSGPDNAAMAFSAGEGLAANVSRPADVSAADQSVPILPDAEPCLETPLLFIQRKKDESLAYVPPLYAKKYNTVYNGTSMPTLGCLVSVVSNVNVM